MARSAAIQIRPPPDPSSTGHSSTATATHKAASKHSGNERSASPRVPPICRNIVIHGSCKFEHEGCRYTHPSNTITAPTSTKQSPKIAAASILTRDAPVFVPAAAASNSGSPRLGHPDTPAFVARLTPSAPTFLPSNGVTAPTTTTSSDSHEPDSTASTGLISQLYARLEAFNTTTIQADPATDETTDKVTLDSSSVDPNATSFEPGMTTFYPDAQYTYPENASLTTTTTTTSGATHPHHPHSHTNPYTAFDPHLVETGYVPAVDGYGLRVGVGGVGLDLSTYRQPLNYHLYAPSLPHVSNQHPHQAIINSFFISTPLRESLQKKSEAILQTPVHQVVKSPADLGVYHSLVVLSPPTKYSSSSSIGGGISTGGGSSTSASAALGILSSITTNLTTTTATTATSSTTHTPSSLSALSSSAAAAASSSPPHSVFGYSTWVYKASCTLDGRSYILLRLEGAKLIEGKSGKNGAGKGNPSLAIREAGRWRKVRHPGIVSVREAFTTRAFGDTSLVFVYDFHPMSQTLLEAHLTPKPPVRDARTGRYKPQSTGITERVLWSYLVQIVNAVKAVHVAGFAVRTIEASKVLLTGENRVRLNGCAVLDVLTYDGGQRLLERQQEDLIALGRLFCAIACTSVTAPMNLVKSMETLTRTYSSEFRDVVMWLLQPPSSQKTIQALTDRISDRIQEELTNSLNGMDLLESGLMRELENGRLVRLMTKFGFINERPEFDHDPRWSETGDRYLIKLFRDYVFHQVDEMGRPVTDLSHVLTCLNKLDASVEEQILLVSRDEQTCMVVSYAEIRKCVDAAFRDLVKR